MSLGGQEIAPALFLAPMEGITHSAFRRLLSDYGGYGALFTEMLSAGAFLQEKTLESPYTRRRPCEGKVIYQFGASGREDLEAVLRKVESLAPDAVDLNLGCPAPKIRAHGWGVSLAADFPRLRTVLERFRRAWPGTLTVKVRLGDDPERWREGFLERVRLFEDLGVDAMTVHARFSGEKLKRRPRWEEFAWIAARTRLPVIGNGDICAPEDLVRHREAFAPLAGLMLGRIAVVKPWIFRAFAGLPVEPPDHAELWDRHYRYLLEDMPPERAFGRLMDFTYYYAKNFLFGHELYRGVQKARTCEEIREAALRFLEAGPTPNRGTGVSFT
ncbi:tRNA-dihydrouridine synthase [Mesoterricola sediminis]|uniref:tRNA-dihydrouridine synthase n=2 Tax=Mesoterricola sediminis TaxID=2927980 RepID=A0AA48GWC9_9BACT|nr:tRNA-dihydrouridine synthase [Mesoterricola sediminis]